MLTVEAQYKAAEVLTSAVDINGKLHRSSEYLVDRIPWLSQDLIKELNPNYPWSSNWKGHQGVVLVHVIIDPKTGVVISSNLKKSSGFRPLDDTAVAALRHWRWKPGKWKEMDVPMRFERPMQQPQPAPPDGYFRHGP